MSNGNEGARDYVGVRKALDGQSLGELEAQVLDEIWTLTEENGNKPVSTTQVFKIMYPKRELSYSTIMLTMAKMSRKGFLTQERTGPKKTDAFVYTPVFDRKTMGKNLLNTVSQAVFGGKTLKQAVEAGLVKL